MKEATTPLWGSSPLSVSNPIPPIARHELNFRWRTVQKSSRWISLYVASHQRRNHHHSCHLESWFRDNAHLPRPSHYPPILRVRARFLCPKCGNWWEHGGFLPGIEFAAVKVKEGDSDSFCNFCEQKLAAERLLQQSPTSKDSASEMQFISVTNSSGKVDKAAGTQVRAHVTPRYHRLGENVKETQSRRFAA